MIFDIVLTGAFCIAVFYAYVFVKKIMAGESSL